MTSWMTICCQVSSSLTFLKRHLFDGTPIVMGGKKRKNRVAVGEAAKVVNVLNHGPLFFHSRGTSSIGRGAQKGARKAADRDDLAVAGSLF